jgi:hypothetical protein
MEIQLTDSVTGEGKLSERAAMRCILGLSG